MLNVGIKIPINSAEEESPGNSNLAFEILSCSQYFRALLNQNERDAKQHPGHRAL